LTISAPQPEPSLAGLHRYTTKNCAVVAPVRWRSRPPPRTDQPCRYESPPSKSSERRCENFLYCYRASICIGGEDLSRARRTRSSIGASSRPPHMRPARFKAHNVLAQVRTLLPTLALMEREAFSA
jgi:hypothetical protein